MKGKDLNKALKDHKHFKQLLAQPIPEGMHRYPGVEQYLIGHTPKISIVTWQKKKHQRRLQSLRKTNERFKGKTPQQIYEQLIDRYPKIKQPS